MRFQPTEPPRVFGVGRGEPFSLKDCGRIELEPNEQVTFVTQSGGEYDVVRKSWGFYATPSLNGRLREFGFRAALVKSDIQRYYVFLVESKKDPDFQAYLESEGHTVVCWLDTDSELKSLERKLGHP